MKDEAADCWICGKHTRSWQNHHITKQRLVDKPDDLPQLKLCAGCHYIVYLLAKRVFLSDAKKVADLITLARFDAGLPDARTIVQYELTKEDKSSGKTIRKSSKA